MATYRSLPHLTTCLHGLLSPWRDETVVVISREWIKDRRTSTLPGPPPAWLVAQYPTFLYQRVESRQLCYTANRAFELGVYLQFIVDHYATGLPLQMAMLQADWFDAPGSWHRYPTPKEPIVLWQPRCATAEWADWMPLGKKHQVWPPYQVERGAQWYQDHARSGRYPNATHLLVEACWRELLGLFGRRPTTTTKTTEQPLRVTFYPAMNFLISRRRVEERPRATWFAAHAQLVTRSVCLHAPVEAASVAGYSVSSSGGLGWLQDVEADAKLTVAQGMEVVAHAVFGHQPAEGRPGALPSMASRNCSAFASLRQRARSAMGVTTTPPLPPAPAAAAKAAKAAAAQAASAPQQQQPASLRGRCAGADTIELTPSEVHSRARCGAGAHIVFVLGSSLASGVMRGELTRSAPMSKARPIWPVLPTGAHVRRYVADWPRVADARGCPGPK